MWYAPKREKFMGGIMLLKKRAPILGGNRIINQGNFAIWAGLFSATDCALIALRKK
jgi:import inner membrane translocase subunit TIM17